MPVINRSPKPDGSVVTAVVGIVILAFALYGIIQVVKLMFV